jgi:hypothetical protein
VLSSAQVGRQAAEAVRPVLLEAVRPVLLEAVRPVLRVVQQAWTAGARAVQAPAPVAERTEAAERRAAARLAWRPEPSEAES